METILNRTSATGLSGGYDMPFALWSRFSARPISRLRDDFSAQPLPRPSGRGCSDDLANLANIDLVEAVRHRQRR